MMKTNHWSLICLLSLAVLVGCKSNEKDNAQTDATPAQENAAFEVSTQGGEKLTFENLRIYPILAAESFLEANSQFTNLINLKEAIDTKGFRITEKKPYGSRNDRNSVNALTIHNKSKDTVFIMAGDVVQGGKQDRVIAHDMVVPPRTLTDVAVFCVEPHRWSYKTEMPTGTEQERNMALTNQKAYAFSGYYHMASNDLRKTVKYSKNQQQVWDKVGELTSLNNAKTSTGTYAALEQSKDFTEQRNAYLEFFRHKMSGYDNAIGAMFVSGSTVLGTDIFHSPDLFQKQYEAILHGYITDAISSGKEVSIGEQTLDRNIKKVKREFSKPLLGEKETETKFKYKGQLIHFSSL
ncbi:MAG: DUF6569 family protein [Bacteroidota bacterium]